MAFRKFPYGYEMKNGMITICESEAETVRFIFTERADGKSNWQIAKELFESNEPYFGDSVSKNSCKISSILYDKRYIGADGYENIVDVELFDKVQELKGECYCKKNKNDNCGESKISEKSNVYNYPTSTVLIPSKAVFEKERQFKTLLKNSNDGKSGNDHKSSNDSNDENADTETLRRLIFELAEEKYSCIL